MADADQTAPTPVIGDLTLPSGAVVTLRDPEDLTGAEYNAIVGGIVRKGDPRDDEGAAAAAGMDMVYGLAAVLVSAWEVPYLPGLLPPCKEPDHLGRLRIRDYNAVIEAAKGAMGILFPGEATVDGAAVPGSPTEPASA